MKDSMFYSPTAKGFYSKAIHKTSIPDDSIELSWEEYEVLISGIMAGGSISITDSGNLVLVKEVYDTNLTAAREERWWRDSELALSDTELNKVQDSDKKAVGTVSQWREYRKALRDWPEHANFPKIEFRPSAPSK